VTDLVDDIEMAPEPPEPSSSPRVRRRRQIVLESSATRPGEEWMLTYMDTVTLLVTFFVMILSFASFDKTRYAAFVDGMSLSKYGTGILMGTIGRSEPVDRSPPDVTTIRLPLLPQPETPGTKNVDDAQLERLDAFRNRIAGEGLGDDIKVRARTGVIEMEINGKVLFALASAELSDAGLRVLSRLSRLLTESPGTFAIEGHTDDLPIRTTRFPSNWELSAARASSVARQLISGGISAKRMRVVGYASSRPIASNATSAGRQQNRRVNIIVEFPEATGD